MAKNALRVELTEAYSKRGIQFVYNDRTRKVYLSVKAAPYFAEGVDGCQTTGHLTLNSMKEAKDVELWTDIVKKNYSQFWKNNPLMIKYAETIITESSNI